MYKPVVIDNRIIDVRPPHACSEIKKVSLCCINEQGRYVACATLQSDIHYTSLHACTPSR